MLPGRSGIDVLSTAAGRQAGAAGDRAHRARRGRASRRPGSTPGAVDYLTKPFSLTELAARIRAQLRAAAQAPRTTLSAGDIEVNLITREVRRGGELVRLSTTEFELLVYLMHNRGHVLSREQILRAVWGYEYDPGTNVVDVYIGYLRRKLRRAGHERADRDRALGRLPAGCEPPRARFDGRSSPSAARDCTRRFRPAFGGG